MRDIVKVSTELLKLIKHVNWSVKNVSQPASFCNAGKCR